MRHDLMIAALLLALGAAAAGDAGSNRAAAAAPPFPCDDAQFLSDRAAFAAGAIRSDQFVDLCGTVSSVLRARTTRSGRHGYFYVTLPPPSNARIEIVANLDAMAEAPTDAPPARWPWVSVGQYVYVQGRYYYDSATRQGVDWTEDDSSRSWPHVGYVAVCDVSAATCTKYW